MAEELSSAFQKAGYDPEYGKVTVSNEHRISVSFSATERWQAAQGIQKSTVYDCR